MNGNVLRLSVANHRETSVAVEDGDLLLYEWKLLALGQWKDEVWEGRPNSPSLPERWPMTSSCALEAASVL